MNHVGGGGKPEVSKLKKMTQVRVNEKRIKKIYSQHIFVMLGSLDISTDIGYFFQPYYDEAAKLETTC